MPEKILITLRKRNVRLTACRAALIELFTKFSKPLSAQELLVLLTKKYQLAVNKTTVYRELDFLLAQNIISTINLGDRQKRYELRDLPHHHHLVCNVCKKIEDIQVEPALEQIERRLAKNNKFTVLQHSLEFFGLCHACTQ